VCNFMEMAEIIFIGPPILLYASWMMVRNKNLSKRIFSLIWVLLIFVLVFIGFFAGHGAEATKTSVVCFFTSTVWFLGPFLLFTLHKEWRAYISLVGSIILPFISYFACLLLMLTFGQIRGV
jgi:hypothetical protein